MHPLPLLLLVRSALVLLLGLGAVAQNQQQQDELWSDEFAPPGVGGPVHAVLSFQGDLIVGGEFRHVRGAITNNVARWNGAVFAPLANGLPGAVRALVVHNQELWAGGDFGIARWTGTAWVRPPGLTLYFGTPEVHALATHQGELWVGGQFDQAGSIAVHGLARWNGTTWSAPPGGNVQHTLQEPRVLALLTGAAGSLFVGGEFEGVGTITANNVAEYTTTWRPLGSGTDRTVRSLCEYQGALHVGGDFDFAGGRAASGLARWTGTQFQVLGTGLTGPYGFAQVFGLASYRGSLIAAGSLATAGGLPVQTIARWDGTQWAALGAGIGTTPGFTAVAKAMVEWRSTLVVGGDFVRVGSSLAAGQAIVTHHLAAWDGVAWSGIGTGLGTDGEVLALARWNGGIVVGGRFGLAGSQFAGGLVWLQGGEYRWLGGFDGPVLDAVDWNGDLVVTGQFRQVDTATGPVFAHAIARFDGQQWHPIGVGAGEYCVAVYQGQLYAGGIGAPRRWTGTTWETFGTSFGGAVTAMVEHQGALYIGGNLSGPGAPPNLARWDGVTMTPVGGGVNGYGVAALASFGNDLIVGGTFSAAGGAPIDNLAAWNGSSFRALGGGVPGSAVYSMTVLGNELWVGADFGNWQSTTTRTYVAKFDGTTWTRPGRGPSGAVLAMCADPSRDQLYTGGWFFECAGRPAWNLCRYDAAPHCQDLGHGSRTQPGFARPELRASGALQAGNTVTVRLQGALPGAIGLHVAGTTRLDVPLFGGVLVPVPMATQLFVGDAAGATTLALPIGLTLPAGSRLFWQCLALDPRTVQGVSVSNAVRQVTW